MSGQLWWPPRTSRSRATEPPASPSPATTRRRGPPAAGPVSWTSGIGQAPPPPAPSTPPRTVPEHAADRATPGLLPRGRLPHRLRRRLHGPEARRWTRGDLRTQTLHVDEAGGRPAAPAPHRPRR
ncbi:hypothetical protein QJS66_00910 [Kocuria rhizophila]|nr:hypothetical protein QJS66_00910 [Kocuria rhizophila]